MSEIPDNLKSAMEQYANIRVELENDADLQLLQASIDSLLIEVDAIEQKIKKLVEPQDKKLEELRDYIRAQVYELEATAKHAGVKAAYRKAYDRETWQGKKMTKILLDNPSLVPIFTPARKVTPVQASVTISYEPEPIAEEAPF